MMTQKMIYQQNHLTHTPSINDWMLPRDWEILQNGTVQKLLHSIMFLKIKLCHGELVTAVAILPDGIKNNKQWYDYMLRQVSAKISDSAG